MGIVRDESVIKDALGPGRAIRLARVFRSMPQHALAAKAQLRQTRLSQIELERVLPTPSENARIWQALTSE